MFSCYKIAFKISFLSFFLFLMMLCFHRSLLFTNCDDMACGHCVFSRWGFSTNFWCLLFNSVQQWVLFTGFVGKMWNYYNEFPADWKSSLSKGMLSIWLVFWNLLKTKFHMSSHGCMFAVTCLLTELQITDGIFFRGSRDWNLILLHNLDDLVNHIHQNTLKIIVQVTLFREKTQVLYD